MTELILTSTDDRPIRPLITAALENELRLLEAGVQRTRLRLKTFEQKYRFSTSEFMEKYEKDELDETLELAEWIGEQRMLERLRDKIDTLKGVRFAN